MAGFVENEDFEVVEILSSPILGSSKARPQKTKDYLLSMDMAKELSMLERNDRGKQARRYFIECEKKLRQVSKPAIDMSDPLVVARLFVQSEEARRAAVLELAQTKVDLQVVEIKSGALAKQVVEKSQQVELLADKLSTNECSCLIEDFARATADMLGYGRTDLFAYLRLKGFLLRRPLNDPSAEMVSAGRFIKVAGRPFTDPVANQQRHSSTTKLTASGYGWLVNYMSKDPDTTLRRMLASSKFAGTNLVYLKGYTLYRDGSPASKDLGEYDRNRAILYSSTSSTRAGIKNWTATLTSLHGVEFGHGSTLEAALVDLSNQNK